MQHAALCRVYDLFTDVRDLRIADWQYSRIAEEPDHDGDLWTFAELAEGRSDFDVASTVLKMFGLVWFGLVYTLPEVLPTGPKGKPTREQF